ncbi:MAG TPA: hypothetical protein VF603_08880 [Allosphingosinicella sp.]|jgi:hypothetical protein
MERDQRASLVAAYWRHYTARSDDECPADHICLNFPADAPLRDVRTLAGPPVPTRLTVRLWVHSDPRPDILHLMIVRPPSAEQPYWRAIRAGNVGRPGEEVCVETALLTQEGVELPPGVRARGEQTCLRIPRDVIRRPA